MTPTTENSILVFRTSKFWKWFFCLLLIPGDIGLFGVAAWQGSMMGFHFLLGILAGVGGVAYGFLISYFVEARVEIDSTEIRLVGVGIFKTKPLPLDEIEGFRILPTQYVKILVLVPKNPRCRKVQISLILERKAELLDWMEHNLTNLDKVEYQQGLLEIYQNEKLGSSPEKKAKSYTQARRWCRILNSVSIGAFFWAFLFPQPYKMAIWTLLLLPFIGLLFLKRFEGIAKFNTKKKSAYPGVDVAFFMPGSGLFLRSLLDWHVLEWNHFWWAFAAISVGLFLVSMFAVREIRQTVTTVLLCCLYSAIYSSGATLCLNGILADSRVTAYHAKVLGKHICNGKTKFYYLTLAPWRNKTEKEDATVSRSVYSKYALGDTAEILVRTGKFGIPYYFIR